MNDLAWLLECADASCTSVCLVNHKLLIADNSIFQGSRDNQTLEFQLDVIKSLSQILQPEKQNEEAQKILLDDLMQRILLKKMHAMFKGALVTNISQNKKIAISKDLVARANGEIDDLALRNKYPAYNEAIGAFRASLEKIRRYLKRIIDFLNNQSDHPLSITLKGIDKIDPKQLSFSAYGAVNYLDQKWLLDDTFGYGIIMTNFNGTHGELKVVDFLIATRLITIDLKPNQLRSPYVIGISKKCCHDCDFAIKIVNECFSFPVIQVTATHGLAFTNWQLTLPLFLKVPEENTKEEYEIGLSENLIDTAEGYTVNKNEKSKKPHREHYFNISELYLDELSKDNEVFLYRDCFLVKKIQDKFYSQDVKKDQSEESSPWQSSAFENESGNDGDQQEHVSFESSSSKVNMLQSSPDVLSVISNQNPRLIELVSSDKLVDELIDRLIFPAQSENLTQEEKKLALEYIQTLEKIKNFLQQEKVKNVILPQGGSFPPNQNQVVGEVLNPPVEFTLANFIPGAAITRCITRDLKVDNNELIDLAVLRYSHFMNWIKGALWSDEQLNSIGNERIKADVLQIQTMLNQITDLKINGTLLCPIVFDDNKNASDGRHFSLLVFRKIADDQVQAMYVDSHGDTAGFGVFLVEAFVTQLSQLKLKLNEQLKEAKEPLITEKKQTELAEIPWGLELTIYCEAYQHNNDCAVHVWQNALILAQLDGKAFNLEIFKQKLEEKKLKNGDQVTLLRYQMAISLQNDKLFLETHEAVVVTENLMNHVNKINQSSSETEQKNESNPVNENEENSAQFSEIIPRNNNLQNKENLINKAQEEKKENIELIKKYVNEAIQIDEELIKLFNPAIEELKKTNSLFAYQIDHNITLNSKEIIQSYLEIIEQNENPLPQSLRGVIEYIKNKSNNEKHNSFSY